jgi:hypothetical protein
MPTAPTVAEDSTPGGSTGLLAGNYLYYVTACNQVGESLPSNVLTVSLALNDAAWLDITMAGSVIPTHFNVYRSAVGATSASTCKFIGRVKYNGVTRFKDYGNKLPGFVTGFLIQKDTMEVAELCPYSRQQLARVDLSTVEAHFRFLTLEMTQPRKNVVVDNIAGY